MKNKRSVLLLVAILAVALVFSACTSSKSVGTMSNEAAIEASKDSLADADLQDGEAASVASVDEERVFTLEELAQFNGKDGVPAYVAVNGIVYDVTDVPQWKNGEHKNGITAGADRTKEITEDSPHGLSVLAELPVVGVLSN